MKQTLPLPVPFYFALLACFFLCAAADADNQTAFAGKPIALVADSYGRYDAQSITRNILDHEDWHFENRGRFLAPSEFENYSIVVIAYSQERPFTAEEHGIVKDYLTKGGRILLLSHAPRNLSDADSADASREWLGFDIRRIKPVDPANAEIVDDKILDGIASLQGPRPSWIAGAYGAANLDPEIEPLIWHGDEALVLQRRVGEGTVYYLGSEIFRLRQPASPHLEDSDSYVALVRNILADAAPLTFADWFAEQASAWSAQGQRFLIWDREWQRGIASGPVFVPPLPSTREVRESLSLHLALDEYETVQVNVTDLGPGGTLTWKVDGGGLPGEGVTVFVQDKPDPIPWPKNPEIARESPFWLMPPEALAPEGTDAVEIAPGQTRIVWLKYHTRDTAPGSYAGSIAFFVDEEPAGTVALDLTVHPVRVPERRLITVQPFGHIYGDVNEAAPTLRFKRNLRDHGFEWTLINVLRPGTFLVDGEPLTAGYIRGNIKKIESASPPVIDFAALDPFIDGAVEHNLTYVRITQSLTESIDGIAGSAGLMGAQARTARHWYLKEFARYLADKGIRNYYASMGDEMNEESLWNRFLPWSKDLVEAGWTSTSSFTTSSVADPELTDALSHVVGSWTLNRLHLPTFTTWRDEGKINLPENVLVGTYGAGEGRGTEIRKNASESRMIGWEAWALGSDYCAPNPYFKGWLYYVEYTADRGVGGERFVAYLDQDDLDAPLLNSPFIEGIRESIEEANLAAIMRWYMEKLGDQVAADLRERAGNIVGEDPGSILQWQPVEGYAESRIINSSREEYAKAKIEVLNILGELRELAGEANIQPDLYWHDIPLIHDGKPVSSVLTEKAFPQLEEASRELAGISLPVQEAPRPADRTVILVAEANDPKVPAWMSARLGRHPGSYSWIRKFPAQDSDQTWLWIGGTDSQQLEKAMARFVQFLRAEGAWFAE